MRQHWTFDQRHWISLSSRSNFIIRFHQREYSRKCSRCLI
uniref:ATEXO70A1 (Exocyst subunit EXO70 family protein A1) n=1 Tax=Arundo donax TaxID=35708 RepID=A0A0A9HDX9_ARUDO